MPARLRSIIAALKLSGIVVEEPKSGSHYMARRGEGRGYPIPAHNALKTEINDKYIKGLCAHFELDPEAFKRLL